MPEGGYQQRLSEYRSSSIDEDIEVYPSSVTGVGIVVPPAVPALVATYLGGARWVPSRFPKAALEAPTVVVPPNRTSRICVPVMNSAVGSFDESKFDPVLGVNHFRLPAGGFDESLVLSGLSQAMLLLGSNPIAALSLPPGRGAVHSVSGDSAIASALE